MWNVNLVKVMMLTKVKAEQFNWTDERGKGEAPARVSEHC